MINRWQKPNSDEIRYYFNFRFGGFFPHMSYGLNRLLAQGRWIGADETGMAHIYQKTQHGIGRCRTEDGEILDKAFGVDGLTFEQWEKIYNRCLTKGGNFSVKKYINLSYVDE